MINLPAIIVIVAIVCASVIAVAGGFIGHRSETTVVTNINVYVIAQEAPLCREETWERRL